MFGGENRNGRRVTPPLVRLSHPYWPVGFPPTEKRRAAVRSRPRPPTFCTFPPHNNLLIPLSRGFIFSSLVLIPFFLFSVCALPHSPAVRPGGRRPVPGIQRLEARSHGPDGPAEVVLGPPQHAPSGPAHETGFNRRCGRDKKISQHSTLTRETSLV